MPFPVGHWELILLGVVLVLLFGTSQLPRIGRQLGRGVRQYTDTIAEVDPRRQLKQLAAPAEELPQDARQRVVPSERRDDRP